MAGGYGPLWESLRRQRMSEATAEAREARAFGNQWPAVEAARRAAANERLQAAARYQRDLLPYQLEIPGVDATLMALRSREPMTPEAAAAAGIVPEVVMVRQYPQEVQQLVLPMSVAQIAANNVRNVGSGALQAEELSVSALGRIGYGGQEARNSQPAMSTPEKRMAGMRLMNYLATDPFGEEILEGTMGGLMAGASQLGSDQPWQQTALETAAAIGGGIGVGMLGRRLGARIGGQVHEGSLADQGGMLAMLGRLGGSETTAQGIKHQGGAMKIGIQESLIEKTSARMAQEAALDPAGFISRYGITPEQFQRVMPQVSGGRKGAAVLEALREMPAGQREEVAQALLSEYKKVEDAVTRHAANTIDERILEMANDPKYASANVPFTDRPMPEALRSLLDPIPPVKGEHVGRAVGRFIGDEVGIIGGLGLGSLAAQQLGIDSPKDQRIRELEEQLKARQAA